MSIRLSIDGRLFSNFLSVRIEVERESSNLLCLSEMIQFINHRSRILGPEHDAIYHSRM